MPIGTSGLRFIDATASVPVQSQVPCRNRNNEVIDTSRDALFSMKSIMKQADDYEALTFYPRPPNWHFAGDLSLATMAEFAHWIYKNLEIEYLKQGIGSESIVSVSQKLCFPTQDYIDSVFEELGPLHTVTMWTLDLMAKWMWSIERCQQLISIWLIEETDDVPRLPVPCHCGSLAVTYCPRPTVNRDNDYRLGPNAAMFALMAILTKLRYIVRSSQIFPFPQLDCAISCCIAN